MKNGDILLYSDGEMIQIVELSFPTSDLVSVISMFDNEQTYRKHYQLEELTNLGQAPSTTATFHAVRSIHLRLNNLGKL